MINDFLTTPEAADYLGVSQQRVAELAETGKIERQRMGRFWLYSKSSMDAWKNAPKNKGGRPPKASAGTSMPASPA